MFFPCNQFHDFSIHLCLLLNAGIPFDSKIGDLILDATAKDPDVPSDEEDIHGGNKITYSIRSSELFRAGSTLSSGSLVPSPFKMEKNGRLVLSSLIGMMTKLLLLFSYLIWGSQVFLFSRIFSLFSFYSGIYTRQIRNRHRSQ